MNYYTLIVNNFQEPSNTPEHNALQAKFLQPAFRLAFVKFLGDYHGDVASTEVLFEHYGFDIDLRGSFDTGKKEKFSGRWEPIWTHVHYSVEIKPTVADDYPAVLRQVKATLAQVFNRYNNSVPSTAYARQFSFSKTIQARARLVRNLSRYSRHQKSK